MTTAEVLSTQQVVITETAVNVLEVTAPTSPAVVEVVTEGPQGAASLPTAVRIDTITTGTVYTGKAPNGASESAATWIITRTTYNAAGARQAKGTATGVTWTGRAGHTYV